MAPYYANMAPNMCSVTRYVKVGTNIEAWYVDTTDDGPDTHRWFQGIVKKVHKYGEDRFGRYVECDVLYDDGELVKEQVFYDGDYGEDVWRFSGELGRLVGNLVSYVDELEDRDEEDPDYEDTDEGSDKDDDSSCAYESESSDDSDALHMSSIGAALLRLEHEKQRAHGWAALMSMALGVMSTVIGTMLARDYCAKHPDGAFFC